MHILSNSVDPDEMPHNMASHLGPHCLLKIQLLFADSNSMLLLFYSILTYHHLNIYSKTCLKRPLSERLKIRFQDQLSLNAGQKYCRMLQGEHSAILSSFIKLSFVFKTCVLPSFSGF